MFSLFIIQFCPFVVQFQCSPVVVYFKSNFGPFLMSKPSLVLIHCYFTFSPDLVQIKSSFKFNSNPILVQFQSTFSPFQTSFLLQHEYKLLYQVTQNIAGFNSFFGYSFIPLTRVLKFSCLYFKTEHLFHHWGKEGGDLSHLKSMCSTDRHT